MGVKRLNRSRLYNIEKKGLDVIDTIGASLGMKPAIVSATQSREGHKVVTDIVVDLGTSKATVKTGGAADGAALGTLDESGVAEVSYLCKLAPSVFGTVTMVETVCLEMPSDGTLLGSTSNAYELRASSAATGKIGAAPAATTIHADLNSIGDAKGKHVSTRAGDGAFAIKTLEDNYLYICVGAGFGGLTAATASITVDDTFLTAQLDSGVSRIVVIATDGTVVEHVFDSGTAKGSSSSGTIGYDGSPDLPEMATSIAAAINNHAKFNASATDKVVNITQGTGGVGGNTTIALVNGVSAAGAALSADLTIANFSGGKTAGTSTAMTQGKFLIRVEGFIEPADL